MPARDGDKVAPPRTLAPILDMTPALDAAGYEVVKIEAHLDSVVPMETVLLHRALPVDVDTARVKL